MARLAASILMPRVRRLVDSRRKFDVEFDLFDEVFPTSPAARREHGRPSTSVA